MSTSANNARDVEMGVPKQEQALQKEQPKRIGLIGSLKRFLLPFLFFNLTTSEGRHQYVENALSGYFGTLLESLPFILAITLASGHPELAIWISFGIQTFVIGLKIYRATYDPTKSYLYWIDAAGFASLLGMGVYYTIAPFEWYWIGTILPTAITAAMVLSMLVCHPFTEQFSRQSITDEVITSSKFFLQMNYFLTTYWVLAMGIMLACTWTAQYLTAPGTAEHLILGTILSIAIPVLAGFATPFVAKMYFVSFAPKEGPVAEAISELKAKMSSEKEVAANQQQQA